MLQSTRLIKGREELAAMRKAGSVLREICDEARGLVRPGRKEFQVVADIDRLARDKGAEDIRILAGEKRLNPPSFQQTAILDQHWVLYLALQHERYWAEAARTFILSPNEAASSAYQRAQEIVGSMANQLKHNGTIAAIDQSARRELGEVHSYASMYGLANGIGLNQWEAPFLNDDDALEVRAMQVGTMLNAGMTLALRVALPADGKMILYGDSFEVTHSGAKSLIRHRSDFNQGACNFPSRRVGSASRPY
jgi:Xaa-Pro aminopeptidase